MSRAVNSSVAPFIRSTSDSEPTRMPTRGSGIGSDVAPEARSLEGDELHRGIRVVARLRRRRPGAGDREDAAAVRHQPAVPNGGAAVEDEGAGGLCLVDAV